MLPGTEELKEKGQLRGARNKPNKTIPKPEPQSQTVRPCQQQSGPSDGYSLALGTHKTPAKLSNISFLLFPLPTLFFFELGSVANNNSKH